MPILGCPLLCLYLRLLYLYLVYAFCGLFTVCIPGLSALSIFSISCPLHLYLCLLYLYLVCVFCGWAAVYVPGLSTLSVFSMPCPLHLHYCVYAYAYIFFLLCQYCWFLFLFLYYKSLSRAFTSNTELINLHSIMFAAISPIVSSASALSKVIALKAFTKHKNLVLGIPGLAISSHVTIYNA